MVVWFSIIMFIKGSISSELHTCVLILFSTILQADCLCLFTQRVMDGQGWELLILNFFPSYHGHSFSASSKFNK